MSGGLKVAIIASVILALAIVGVLVDDRFGADQDGAVKARETVTAAPEDIKPVGKPLDLGVEAKVSSHYRVTITEVSRYDVPGGQLMAPTVKATYIGKDDGEPWSDLSLEFSIPGSEEFGEFQCPAGVGDDSADRAALGTGDEATYVVCLNVPEKDTEGGRITVQEAFTNDKGAWWSTDEAVVKALPSVAPPASSGGGAPATRPKPSNVDRSDDDDRCDDFDDEEYERQKDYGEYLEDQYEAKKDTLDEDDIDDYKDWKEDHDKAMDYYEKWHEECG